jgi:DNA-binding NtrC family response regulator
MTPGIWYNNKYVINIALTGGNFQMAKKKVMVLVVDDEDIMRNFLYDLLTDEGYKVYSAASADAALKEIKRNHFDLVITDIVMKKMDGIELIKNAKAIDPQTEFIVITAYATPVTFDQSMQLGAINYLTKPIDIDQLRVLISRIIHK